MAPQEHRAGRLAWAAMPIIGRMKADDVCVERLPVYWVSSGFPCAQHTHRTVGASAPVIKQRWGPLLGHCKHPKTPGQNHPKVQFSTFKAVRFPQTHTVLPAVKDGGHNMVLRREPPNPSQFLHQCTQFPSASLSPTDLSSLSCSSRTLVGF